MFAIALLVGIVSGTYSSIFNASMLLVVWETGELRRLFRRPRLVGAASSS
jgi:preprotein translocase subunit SecF